jgi:hypothetical protein
MKNRTEEMQDIVNKTSKVPEEYREAVEQLSKVYEETLVMAREIDHEALAVSFAAMAVSFRSLAPKEFMQFYDALFPKRG